MRWFPGPGMLLILVAGAGNFLVAQQSMPGEVHSGNEPVAGARVRYQGQCQWVVTDQAGRFELKSDSGKSQRITAWKEGYAVAARPLTRSAKRPLRLELVPLPRVDNENYEWIDPAVDPQKPHNCANCHAEIYREWAGSAHARAAGNKRLLNLVGGTDWQGKPSPTWSLKHEHPLGSAVCSRCHAPTFRDPTLEYDLNRASGVAARGVHCDFCHKIAEAPTDKIGQRFGRDGYQLLRPSGKELLFFGPLEDAFRQGEMFAYSLLYKDSRYCASCHEGVIFGVHVYGTYSEWLASPARRKGQHCQTCHMAPTGKLTNIAPGHGGIEREPHTLASHGTPGGDAEMLRRCLKLDGKATRVRQGVRLDIAVLAREVGHRVPTGFIDRNLALVVQGINRSGQPVNAKDGPRLPAGVGKDLTGQAGWLYAKQLMDDTGKGPQPFWLPGCKLTDTRLQPEQPDHRTFLFPAEVVRFRVRLIYRRFWADVSANKGWPDDSLTVVEREFAVSP